MKTVLVTFNSKYIHSSLALASLSSYLKKRGHQVTTLEFSLQTPVLSALSEVFAEEPAVVGIALHIWNRQQSFSLAKLIKTVMTNVVLILGGPEVSFAVEDAFAEFPQIDFIVQGEGEEVLCDLLRQIEKGECGKTVPGAAWLGEKGEIHFVGGAQIVKDISILEFPYDFSDDRLKHKIVYYESTRGCPFSCTYCLSGVSREVRFKPLEQVYIDMQKFIMAGVKQVKFIDRTYNLDKKHYFPMMHWLAEQDTQTNFHFEIKADNLDEEILEFLANVPVGRFQFEIGVQSVHEKTLAVSGRKQDWDRLSDAVKKLKNYRNIHLHLDLIAGLPFESMQDFAVSFNKVYELQPDMLQLGFLKLLRGSLLQLTAKEYCYSFMSEPPYEVLANKFISYSELRKLKLLEAVFEQTYNSGKFMYSLQYIVEEFYDNEAYVFYSKLADWWERKGLFVLGQNAQAIAEHLVAFCKEYGTVDKYFCLLDCVKLDIILFHDKNFRPNWLDWQTTGTGTKSERFWRAESLVCKYLPNYKFNNWRDINNNYYIEVFEHYLYRRKLTEKQAVFFDKNHSQYILLQKEDFF